MRLSRLAVVVAVPLLQFPTAVTAQQPLRVVRHAPIDTIRPSQSITISFDRPVGGSLERTPDPQKILRVEPAIDARFEWRDPVTLRIAPRKPLAPGSRYEVILSNDFAAMDGGRLGAAYRFTLRTKGPALLMSAPGLAINHRAVLEPNGRLRLAYSAPIDSALFSEVVRLELDGNRAACPRRTIAYRVRSSRPVRDDDGQFAYTGYGADSAERAYRRLVELRPVAPIPPSCEGAIVLPSLDPAERPEIRYQVAGAPLFTLAGVVCDDADCVAGGWISAVFTAAVHRDSIAGKVHVEPDVPFTIRGGSDVQHSWQLRLRMAPRTRYVVRVDSSLRDVFGRRLTGRRVASLTTGDRAPALGHATGFTTVSSASPTFRVRHVNIDTLELAITAIPERLRIAAIQTADDADSIVRLVGQLGRPVVHRVALGASFNSERTTDIRLPRATLGPAGQSSLLAIRARGITRRRAPAEEQVFVVPPARSTIPIDTVDLRPFALVQFTDLIAHAKVTDDGGAVLVMNGTTGKPVPGARVTARDTLDRVVAAGVSDTTGVAMLAPTGVRPVAGTRSVSRYRYPDYSEMVRNIRVVEVSSGRDRSLTVVARGTSWNNIESVSRMGGHEYPARKIHASVSTERGIYRPGEMIYVSAIVRRGPLTNLQPPAPGDSVRLRVARTYPGEPEPRTVRERYIRTTPFGMVADSFALPPNAPLGGYEVSVASSDGEQSDEARTWFRLAEYRAPEFETTLVLDSSVRFLGDSISMQVNGRYYFGAPMAGAVFRWNMHITDNHGIYLPGLPSGFVIGTSYRSYVPQRPGRVEMTHGSDTLDASGRRRLRLPTTVGASTMPAHVSVSIAVDDVNRQAVSASQSIVLHSSSYYIAARESEGQRSSWTANAPRRFDVLAVRPDGRRVAGVRARVATVRHRGVAVLQDDGSAPAWTWKADTLNRDTVITRDSIVSYTFTPPGEGVYELIFTGVDERSRRFETTLSGSIANVEWVNGLNSPLAMSLETDSSEVAPGDTLTLRFSSPFERAEAWVTAEREGVLAQRRLVVMKGENVVRLPVTQSFIPHTELSVLLVDAAPIWAKDSAQHRLRAGYTRVHVSTKSKQLAIALRPEASRYRPGDSVRIAVRVTDHRERPVVAQVAMWAVDEGVLALTGGGRPDPARQIHHSYGTALQFGTNALTVALPMRLLRLADLMEVRAGFFSASRALSANAYGAAAANDEIAISTRDGARSHFRSTAFFVSSLVTNASGEAVTTIKLPDNLTRYRIVAIAATAGDAYGAADSTITVSQPLIARPALPRFLREGDAVRAGAVLNNTTTESLVARVTASGDRIGFGRDITATRTLAPNAAAEARFDWQANGLPGDSSLFRFSVSGGPHTDAVETWLPIRAPYAPRSHAVSGVARGSASVRMMLPLDIDPARSRLTLRVGTSPVPLVQAAYAWTSVYPYQCSEQLTSTGNVLLAVLRLQQAGLLDSTRSPTAATLRGRLQYVLDELARRQDYFGAIGYWTSGSWSTRWLSAYAGQLLVEARSAGFRTDSVVIDRIARYTQFEPDTVAAVRGVQYGTRAERARDVAYDLAENLAVLHFLRAAGNADTVRENQMVRRTSEMVWEDRVWLAKLLAARTNRAAARAQLERVWRDVEQAGARVDIPDSLVRTLGFRSHIRPAVRLLQATMAADPEHPSLSALVERIVQLGRAEHHAMWSSQDYAVLSNAMADLAIAQRRATPSAPITVTSAKGSGRVLLAGIGGSDAGATDGAVSLDGLLERDGEWMTLPLRIEGGNDPTFYVLTVDEVPRTPPTTPDAKGITVERWFERFDDARPVTEVVEGELVRARLRITVPTDREFVAVSDLLPAGLEVIDVTLRTSSVGPFRSETSDEAMRTGTRANAGSSSLPWLYGSWSFGWWSPWEHEEKRDDRVTYFARVLWRGTYTATYVARATTAGTFVHPPAHAEEMYNPSVGGRSVGGTFRINPRQ